MSDELTAGYPMPGAGVLTGTADRSDKCVVFNSSVKRQYFCFAI